jgi:glycosyltransferase involved in cell wall biosynthesis
MTDAPARTELILDLSRLISRVLHAMPTGVDRVEMAYAQDLLARFPDRLEFAAIHPTGIYGRLEKSAAIRFLDATERRWASRGASSWLLTRLWALRQFVALRPRRVPRKRKDERRAYIQASPHHLHCDRQMVKKLRREHAPLVCLVHDLIPIEFPEYARPNGATQHRLRMMTVARLAAGVIANSHATALSFERFIAAGTRRPAIRVAHLGTAPPLSGPAGEPPSTLIPHRPYFVVIGTIEPRKNHIMLLNIWRRMVEEVGHADTPVLIIIGRRGWENENVVDMLERCEALQHHVVEYSGLSDAAMAQLLASAAALLLPSFAEGFGMPVTEALAAGIPVICSDIPALREAACGYADYLDPLDGPAWIDAVLDYARPGSPRRAAQTDRIVAWTPPSWQTHIDVVLELVDEVAR